MLGDPRTEPRRDGLAEVSRLVLARPPLSNLFKSEICSLLTADRRSWSHCVCLVYVR